MELNYGSTAVKINNKNLFIAVILFLNAMFFCYAITFKNNLNLGIYVTILTLELLVFLKINRYKIVSINTAFVFCLCIFVLFAPVLLWMNELPVTQSPFWLLCGFGTYLLGMYISPKIKFNSKKRMKFKLIKLDWRITVYGLYLIALLAACYYFIQNKNSILGNMNSGRVEAMAGNGIIVLVIKTFTISVPMLLYLMLEKRISKLTFLMLALIALVMTFVIGYKAYCLTIVIICLLMFCRRKIIPIKKLIFIVLSIFLLLYCLDYIRAILSNESITFLSKIFGHMTVNYQNYERIIYWFPKNKEFQFGYTYLINFKMLLPGPDIDFTLWLKETLEMKFSGGGVTPTIFGEFYINFSYFGILIGMLVYGFFSDKISKMYIRSGHKWYVCFICWQFVHSITGGFANVIVDTLLLLLIGGIITKLSNLENNEGWKHEQY